MDVWAADERAMVTAIRLLEEAASKTKAGAEDEDDDRQMSG